MGCLTVELDFVVRWGSRTLFEIFVEVEVQLPIHYNAVFAREADVDLTDASRLYRERGHVGPAVQV
jgi:hypothetical protein